MPAGPIVVNGSTVLTTNSLTATSPITLTNTAGGSDIGFNQAALLNLSNAGNVYNGTTATLSAYISMASKKVVVPDAVTAGSGINIASNNTNGTVVVTNTGVLTTPGLSDVTAVDDSTATPVFLNTITQDQAASGLIQNLPAASSNGDPGYTAISSVAGDGGGADAGGALPGGDGGGHSFAGGVGGAADGIEGAGAGGPGSWTAGTGGAGSADQVGGTGGSLNFTAGAGGSDGGAGAGASGTINLNGATVISEGLAVGDDSSVDGNLGVLGETSTEELTIGAGTLITGHLSGTGSLNFDLTAVTVQDLTVTVTGAALGDTVSIGVPNGSVTTSVQYTGWVSASNTVTIRARTSAAGENPASGTFRADVWKH